MRWRRGDFYAGAVDDHVNALVRLALEEDIGPGDVTSEFFVPAECRAEGFIIAREPGVVAGTEVAREVFHAVDAGIDVVILVPDGASVAPGAHVLQVSGPARPVLTAERTALNFLQRLSGVATMTRRFVDEIEGTGAHILDTRKTTPGWRALEKAAVLAGGGRNHRLGLYDRVMVKDNHLVAEGNLAALQVAINGFRRVHPEVEVEVEADRLEQVRDFLQLEGVDYILLDNMTNEDMASAVALRGESGPALEASGGVSLQTVRAIAETGVDAISVGAITHSAGSLDLSLDLETK